MLREKKSADRKAMAQAVLALAEQHGVAARVEYEQPTCIALDLRLPGGLCLHLDFDGRSCQPDVYVLSWHMRYDTDTGLFVSPAFWPSHNSVHYKKATVVAYGFEDLMASLTRAFQGAADGSAYVREMPRR